MTEELEISAAAFFRMVGKDVVTEKEFTMSVALDFKWMSIKEAEHFMKALVNAGLLVRSNGYLKAGRNFETVQVPIAYRPSDNLKKSLAGTVEKKVPAKTATDPPGDIFMEMIKIADKMGIPKGKFVSESNILKKKLGVETCVAALILLRDSHVDITELKDRVYTQVLGK